MKIKRLSKKKESWEFRLSSEDHTLANLIRELSWKNKGEAVYRVEHPLLGGPVVKVSASNPQAVLRKVAKEIVRLSEAVEKAFSK